MKSLNAAVSYNLTHFYQRDSYEASPMLLKLPRCLTVTTCVGEVHKPEGVLPLTRSPKNEKCTQTWSHCLYLGLKLSRPASRLGTIDPTFCQPLHTRFSPARMWLDLWTISLPIDVSVMDQTF